MPINRNKSKRNTKALFNLSVFISVCGLIMIFSFKDESEYLVVGLASSCSVFFTLISTRIKFVWNLLECLYRKGVLVYGWGYANRVFWVGL